MKPVGKTDYMAGTTGFTMVVFNANDVPVNTQVYIDTPAPQAAPSEHKLVPVDPTPEMIEAGARDGVQGDFDNDLSNGVKELSRAFAASSYRAMLAAAPAVAITQAATSEPVAADCHKCGMPMFKNPHPDAGKPEVYLEVGCPTECLPCTVKSRHGWYRRAMEAQTKAGELEKQLAHLAGTTPNTEAPSDEPYSLDLSDPWVVAARKADHLCPTELSSPDKWRWKGAYMREQLAALSAQQAGVQEAPSHSELLTLATGYDDVIRRICFEYSAGGYNSDGFMPPVTADAKLRWIIAEERRAALAAATQTEKP